ncbi:MAG: hypothetical protein ACTSQV_00620, partial [Alphaproteobacteria bacterium]
TALVLADGGKQDIAEAAKWLFIAEQGGHKLAKVSLEQILKYRPRAFIRDAQRAARDWLRSFNQKSSAPN